MDYAEACSGLYQLPSLEQLYKSPGWPLMVKASAVLGSPLLLREALSISITSPLYHDAIYIYMPVQHERIQQSSLISNVALLFPKILYF